MGVTEYRRMGRKGTALILVIAAVAILVAFYSISISKYHIGFGEAIGIIVKNLTGGTFDTFEEGLKNNIVWENYLPMIIGGLFIGGILGIGGAVMQTIIRNPVADPYTTGISSGALFGVTVFIVLGSGFTGIGYELGMMLNAFVFSLVPAAFIVLFSMVRKTTPTMMVLIGIAVMYVFSAMTTLLKYTATDDEITTIFAWSVGTLGGIGWTDAGYLMIAFTAIAASMMFLSNRLNVITSGDNAAIGLGVDPNRTRVLCLVLVSVATSVAVCFSGTIGFIGLVAPHIARVLVGSNMKLLIPCSAVVCSLLLVFSESLARCIGPTGMSVGVVTALIGGPFFLYFIVKQKKGTW